MSETARNASTLAQDYSVVWRNTDYEYYVEGSGLARLGADHWVAVVPVVPRSQWAHRRAEQSRTHILRSSDGGDSWQKIAELPYYSAIPWLHDGGIYLFANKGGTEFRNDDLLLLRSDDDGATWSDAVTLFEGHFWNCQTGMVVRDGRIYWALDDISFGMSWRGPRVVVGDLSADLMDPAAWRISNPVPYPGTPEALVAPAFAHLGSKYLEPNVIEVGGRVRVLATVKPHGQSTTGLGAVLDLTDDGESLDLQFTQFHPMPGGQLKFCVIRDEVSGMFWATGNLAVDGQQQVDLARAGRSEDCREALDGNDRRFLMLFYGLDGLNWFPAGCIARANGLRQSFNYPTAVIDGDDLCVISRSNVDGPNRHDADCATFHRVRNFRDLALDLWPRHGPER